MKSKIAIKIMTVLTIYLIFALLPKPVYAQEAEIKINVSPKEVHQGELLTINLTFTSEKEGIGALNAFINYDSDLLEYKYGGGNAAQLSSGSGGISDNGTGNSKKMVYSFVFLAKKTGKANFSVADSEVIGYQSKNLLGSPQKEIAIHIGEAKVIEQPSLIDPTNDPVEVMLNGRKLYFVREITDTDIPKGFTLSTISFNGESVGGAVNKSNGMLLVYALDDELNASWFIYENSGDLYPYISFGSNDNFTILPYTDIPLGYETKRIEINGEKVDVLFMKGKREEFYLLYGVNSTGSEGFYLYDSVEGTIQRAWVTANTIVKEEEPKIIKEYKRQVLCMILSIACICFILLMALMVTNKRYEKLKNDKLTGGKTNAI